MSHPLPPLVPQPPRLVTLWSELDATSQIGQEIRDVIIDNIQTALTGIDVVLNQQREGKGARANFVYKLDEEIDNMDIEEVKSYAKGFRDG